MQNEFSHFAKRIGREASIWEGRAGKILQYICWKSRYLLHQRNRAIEVFLNGASTQAFQPDDEDCTINWRTLEQFTAEWQPGLSPTAEIRAALAHLIAVQFALVNGQMPCLWAALGLDDAATQDAYTQLYQHPLETIFSPAPPADFPPESLPGVDWMQPEDLQTLQNAIERIHLKSGETLFDQGEPSDGMYVISSGRVQVVIHRDGQPHRLAERGRDELIGEMALLTGETRSASISALRDTELYRLKKSTFEDMTARYPRLTMQMTRTLAHRLMDTARLARCPHPITAIALLPAGEGVDLTGFAAALTHALSAHGAALHLDSHMVDRQLDKSGAVQAEEGSFEALHLASWLGDCEENHQFVIYECDITLNCWTRRCLRQADRLLLVGQAQANPQCNPLEQAVMAAGADLCRARRELVLLHESSSETPSGTRAWLAQRAVADHYHIAPSDPAHMPRLARLLVGKPICLVMSGGGVRGFVHLGVVRALREVGITADMVCGSSAGSIMAGGLALGMDDVTLEERSRAIMPKPTALFADYTLPLTSLSAGGRVNAMLKKLLGDAQIEDLWLKFFCTSVDLTEARLRLHREGLLRKYVRASCSLPVVYPPVLDDGHLLVDGGLMNNMPIDPMLEIAPGGVMIAINISPDFYAANEAFNYGESLGFWKMINGRLNPFGKKMIAPSVMNILLRSIEIGSKSLEAAQIAKTDLCVQVLGGPSIISPASPDLLIGMGYAAAKESLASEKGQALLAKASLG